MSPRRRAPLAGPATLFAVASKRFRVALVATAGLSAAAKLGAIGVAMRVAVDDMRGATLMATAVAACFAALRVVGSSARVSAECDLNVAMARSLLESDVLVAPTSYPLRMLPEPAFYARALMTDAIPELVASTLAALVAAPLLASRLSPRALGLGALAVLVVMIVLVALSRFTAALQVRVMKSQLDVADRIGSATEGRLELVARGAEQTEMRALLRSIDHYRGVAYRGGWSTALVGRAPLAAGLASVLMVVLLDSSYREAITSALLGQALVLAACVPVLLGVVLRANDCTRLLAKIAPVLDVLDAPRRGELVRAGVAPPPLPATLVADAVSFAYGDDRDPTLDGISFEWRPATALVIEGANGAGKSTLLRLLLGLRSPQSGSFTIGGVPLAKLDLRALRRGIAYLPQRPYLGEPTTTVGAALRGVDEVAGDEALRSVLERVGLGRATASRGEILEVTLAEFSAGQRQRLGLARMLLQDAAIVLLDEPDANLDRAGLALVGEIIAELLSRGRMVAVAAHTLELSSIKGTHVRLT